MFSILSRNQIKFIRSLKQKKYRSKFKNYIIEGEKLISDVALHTPGSMEYVVVCDGFDKTPNHIACEVYQTDKNSFGAISQMVHPQGILAVCHIPAEYFSEKWAGDGFALYFDGVQDPGNLGTMLRAAEWFGVRNVMMGPGTVDPYSSKVVQAAMGSHAYIHIYQGEPGYLAGLNCPIMAADMDGVDAYEMDWPENGVLILGNEGQGISQTILEYVTQRITLPLKPDVRTESLNVSMACTSLLTLRDVFYLQG